MLVDNIQRQASKLIIQVLEDQMLDFPRFNNGWALKGSALNGLPYNDWYYYGCVISISQDQVAMTVAITLHDATMLLQLLDFMNVQVLS